MPKTDKVKSSRKRRAAEAARKVKSAAKDDTGAAAAATARAPPVRVRTTCISNNCNAICKKRMILCPEHQTTEVLNELPLTTEFSRTEVHLLTGLDDLDFVPRGQDPVPLSMFIDRVTPDLALAKQKLLDYAAMCVLAHKSAEVAWRAKHGAIKAENSVSNYLSACIKVMGMSPDAVRAVIKDNCETFRVTDEGTCYPTELAVNIR